MEECTRASRWARCVRIRRGLSAPVTVVVDAGRSRGFEIAAAMLPEPRVSLACADAPLRVLVQQKSDKSL